MTKLLFLLPIAIIGGLGLVYIMVAEAPADRPTSRQERVLDLYEREVTEWLAQLPVSGKAAFVAALAGDHHGQLHSRTERALWLSGRFAPAPGPTMTGALLKRVLPSTSAGTPRGQAIKAARNARAQVAITGNVHEFSDAGGQARLDVEVEVLEAGGTSALIANQRFDLVAPAPLLGTDGWTGLPAGAPSLVTAGLWLLGSLIAPFLLLPLIRMLLRQESNGINLVLLLGLAGSSAAAGYSLFLTAWEALWALAAFLLLLFAAVWYYFIVLDRMADGQ